MEELKAREESGRPWDLQTDKSLLKALQDLSGDMMASIQGLEDKLSSLEKSARSLSLRAGTAAVNFNEACQTQLIQQVSATQTRIFLLLLPDELACTNSDILHCFLQTTFSL